MLHVKASHSRNALGGGARPTFYLAELLDETLINLFDLLLHEPLRLSVVLAILSALTASVEEVRREDSSCPLMASDGVSDCLPH